MNRAHVHHPSMSRQPSQSDINEGHIQYQLSLRKNNLHSLLMQRRNINYLKTLEDIVNASTHKLSSSSVSDIEIKETCLNFYNRLSNERSLSEGIKEKIEILIYTVIERKDHFTLSEETCSTILLLIRIMTSWNNKDIRNPKMILHFVLSYFNLYRYNKTFPIIVQIFSYLLRKLYEVVQPIKKTIYSIIFDVWALRDELRIEYKYEVISEIILFTFLVIRIDSFSLSVIAKYALLDSLHSYLSSSNGDTSIKKLILNQLILFVQDKTESILLNYFIFEMDLLEHIDTALRTNTDKDVLSLCFVLIKSIADKHRKEYFENLALEFIIKLVIEHNSQESIECLLSLYLVMENVDISTSLLVLRTAIELISDSSANWRKRCGFSLLLAVVEKSRDSNNYLLIIQECKIRGVADIIDVDLLRVNEYAELAMLKKYFDDDTQMELY